MKSNKTLKILGNLDVGVSCVMMVALVILTFVGVLMRYIMRSPITWQEEVQMLLFLWIVFLGGAGAFRAGSHIAIEILVDALPKKIGGVIERFDVLLQLLILVYLFWQEIQYYNQLIVAGRVTNLLRLPYGVAYAVVPIGGALMLISMLYAAYGRFIKKSGKEEVL
ncbi:MAG: TRAP transporter small permease [Oscillibacter sp.]|jgi:TRAP-type C4-dicarboxylate transport system permease small subunit|nr:TRAP transporter small permease [Oscillibacter sp.]MCI8690205.1 TRAP transporter small permease [Oscillibacter sp.]MCI9376403.1 TRAP transporter small permease [Oscillibacter sp.]MCI9481539.1 TRAP transporter small permease [Oscillibacter sp.]